MSAGQIALGVLLGSLGTIAIQTFVDIPEAVKQLAELPAMITPQGQLFAQAKAAVTPMLIDPYSAKFEAFREVDTPYGTAVCGLVNAKNRMGAYIGRSRFVYLAAGGTTEIEGTDKEKDRSVFIEVCDIGYRKPTPAAVTTPPQAPAQAQTPLPAPAPNPPSYVVHITSQRTEADARASWKAAQARYPKTLGTAQPTFKRVTIKGETYHRVLIGPYLKSDADMMCAALRGQGGDCLVTEE